MKTMVLFGELFSTWLATLNYLTRGGVQRRALLLSASFLVAEEEPQTSSLTEHARRNAMPSAPRDPKCVPRPPASSIGV